MIAILGDGLLGTELHNQTDWPIFSRRKGTLSIDDISTFEAFTNYSTVVNCIAHTDTYSNERAKHWAVNVEFVDKLIDFTNDRSIKVVHISTDYLYAGSTENATEESLPIPISTWYGHTKVIGDSLVQLRSKNHLICRLSHKPNPFPYDTAWTNIRTCGDYVDVIADLVIQLVNRNATGVFNVGTDPKTIWELAQRTRSIEGSVAPFKVPTDTTIDTTKLTRILSSAK